MKPVNPSQALPSPLNIRVERAIAYFGGPSALARALRCSAPAVTRMRQHFLLNQARAKQLVEDYPHLLELHEDRPQRTQGGRRSAALSHA